MHILSQGLGLLIDLFICQTVEKLDPPGTL